LQKFDLASPELNNGEPYGHITCWIPKADTKGKKGIPKCVTTIKIFRAKFNIVGRDFDEISAFLMPIMTVIQQVIVKGVASKKLHEEVTSYIEFIRKEEEAITKKFLRENGLEATPIKKSKRA
jgi:hypothetical protein